MDIAVTNKSLYAYFKENAINHVDKILYKSETECFSWGESFKILKRLINMFRSFGMCKGKNVAISAPRTIDTPFLIAAVIATGALLILTDPTKSSKEYLAECGTDIKIDFYLSAENEETGDFKCAFKKGKVIFFNKKLISENTEIDDKDMLTCTEKKPSFLFFTSGSTGKSKGVLVSEYSMVKNAWRQFLHTDKNPNMLSTYILPAYHIFGVAVLLESMITSSSIFFPKNRDVNYVLSCMEKYRCDRIESVPTYFLMLAEVQQQKKYNIPSLCGVIAGGACSRQQFLDIEKGLGIRMCTAYGMTELSSSVCSTKMEDRNDAQDNGIGKYMEGVDGALKTTDGKIITKPNVEGELCIRGDSLMVGYYGKNGEIELPVDSEGYFHTGDLAYKDEKENLYIVGRCKDVIIRGGENISPQRIENFITAVKGVQNACVVGIPNEKYGEVVGALVVSKTVDEQTLCNILKEKLNNIELPVKYIFSENMPTNAAGKNDKLSIQKLFAELMTDDMKRCN